MSGPAMLTADVAKLYSCQKPSAIKGSKAFSPQQKQSDPAEGRAQKELHAVHCAYGSQQHPPLQKDTGSPLGPQDGVAVPHAALGVVPKPDRPAL